MTKRQPTDHLITLGAMLKENPISPLGLAVAQLLDDVWGLHHLYAGTLLAIDWANTHHLTVDLGWTNLSTFDTDVLTVLVVRAHDLMLRVSIEPLDAKYLRLVFHLRTQRRGDVGKRMPTMERHLKQIRMRFGADTITEEPKHFYQLTDGKNIFDTKYLTEVDAELGNQRQVLGRSKTQWVRAQEDE